MAEVVPSTPNTINTDAGTTRLVDMAQPCHICRAPIEGLQIVYIWGRGQNRYRCCRSAHVWMIETCFGHCVWISISKCFRIVLKMFSIWFLSTPQKVGKSERFWAALTRHPAAKQHRHMAVARSKRIARPGPLDRSESRYSRQTQTADIRRQIL